MLAVVLGPGERGGDVCRGNGGGSGGGVKDDIKTTMNDSPATFTTTTTSTLTTTSTTTTITTTLTTSITTFIAISKILLTTVMTHTVVERIRTALNHIWICFLSQHQRQRTERKCPFSEHDQLTIANDRDTKKEQALSITF